VGKDGEARGKGGGGMPVMGKMLLGDGN